MVNVAPFFSSLQCFVIMVKIFKVVLLPKLPEPAGLTHISCLSKFRRLRVLLTLHAMGTCFFFISPASKVMQVYILSKLCQTGQVNQSTRNHCCPSDSSMQDRRQSKKTCLGTKYVHTAAVKVAKCLQPKEGGRKEGRFLWSQTRHYSFDWMDCLSFIWSPVHFLMKLFKIVETQATHRGQCNNDIADFILK